MAAELLGIVIESTELNKRQVAAAQREALRVTAQHHRRYTMGDHFKVNAKTAPGGAYGYVARSPGYVLRKLRQYGHNIPWYRTGRASRFIYSNSVVRATQHRATLEIKAPFPLRPQARRELEAMTDDERQGARGVARDSFYKLAEDPSKLIRRRTRIT